MSAPSHITVTFNNWRNPNAGAAYKNNAGELEYTLTDLATSEADALRAECGILRTEKHADAEAIGALRTENEHLREALEEISEGGRPASPTEYIRCRDIARAALG